MPPSSLRMLDVDRAKGLAILLVVFGHLVARQGPAGVVWYEKARILVYLFHMPLFMYLSGLVATRFDGPAPGARGWFRLVGRGAERLLLPFALFGLVILLGKLAISGLVAVDNRPSGLWAGLGGMVWNTGASPALSVWYLAVLFVYRAATPLLARRRGLPILVAAALYPLPAPPLMYADRICLYYVFFVAGRLAAGAGGRWSAALDRWWPVCAVAFVLLLGSVCAGLFPIDFVAGAAGWPYRALMLATSLVAIPTVHGLVRATPLARSRALVLLGACALPIYLLNTICIGTAKGVLTLFASWDGANFVPFALALMAAGTLGPILLGSLVLARLPVLRRMAA